MYCKKYWDVLYTKGKMNFGAYNYIKNALLEYATDWQILYVYLYQVKKEKELTIYQAIYAAREYDEKIKSENRKAGNVKNKYQDITLEDLLCQ